MRINNTKEVERKGYMADKSKNCIVLKELVLPFIVLITVLGVNTWFLFVRGNAYIDSDMASNVLAAVNANAEHTLLSRNWYYSTVIGIFTDIHIFQLVLLFIKDNLLFARAIGVLLMQILLILSFLFLMKQIKISRSTAILFAAFTVAPISYWLLLMISFGAYYIMITVHAIISIVLLIWFTKVESNTKRRSFIVCIVLTIVMGVITGLNGLKGLIFPYAPIFVMTFLMLAFNSRNNKKIFCKENEFELRALAGATIGLFAYAVGFLINSLYFSKIYVFEDKNDVVWGAFSIDKFIEGISECISLLGYQSDEIVSFFTREASLRSVFSLQGIANIFGLAIIGVFIISIVRLIMNYRTLSKVEQMMIVLLISSLLVGCVIFKLTEGYDTSAVYWVPLYPLMLTIIAIELKTESFVFDMSPSVIALMLTFCVAVTSLSTIKLYQEAPMHANPQLVNVAKWLEDNGYEKGYGTFWNSNSVTFLTNGRIDMWSVYGFDSLELDKWLQKASHNEKPKGDKIFALIGPKDELDRDVFLQYMNTEPGIPEIVYQDDKGYIVVEYK